MIADWLRRQARVLGVVEPDSGPWKGNVLWGTERTFIMPTVQDQLIPFTGLDAVPGPPRVYTVQLFKSQNIATRNSDWRAKLTWGVGSIRRSCLVDWGHGMHLSVLANDFRLDAVSHRPAVFSPISGAGDEWVLGATFGAGARAHGPPVVLTDQVFEVGGGGGTVQVGPVPIMARGLIVRTRNTTTNLTNADPAVPTLVRVSMTQNGGGLAAALVTADAQLWASAGEMGIPIPIGTEALFIENGAANTVRVCLQWVLSL